MSPIVADLPPAIVQHTVAPPSAIATALPAKARARWVDYRVRPGDTLYDLADRHRTTVSALARHNDLGHGRWLRVGQVIEVPAQKSAPTSKKHESKGGSKKASGSKASGSKASGSKVTVGPGDTLSHLSARYDVSVTAIQRANGLRFGDFIYPGQRLVIPGHTAKSSGSTSDQKGHKSSGKKKSSGSKGSGSKKSSRTVTVRAGDTLSHLAVRYDVSLSALIKANPGISARHLWVGQRVSLPGSSHSGTSASKGAHKGGKTKPSTHTSSSSHRSRSASDLRVSSSVSSNRAALAGVDVPSKAEIRRMVVATAKRHGVDPDLMLAISFTESSWNHRSVSYVNAIGTMQVIPSSGQWAGNMVGRSLNLMDPQDNITAGTVIMRSNLRAADNEDQAIAAYYQGLYGVQHYGMYPDTKTYVKVVKGHRARFR